MTYRLTWDQWCQMSEGSRLEYERLKNVGAIKMKPISLTECQIIVSEELNEFPEERKKKVVSP